MKRIAVTTALLEEQLNRKHIVIVKRRNSKAIVFFLPIFSMRRRETRMPGNSARVVQRSWL